MSKKKKPHPLWSKEQAAAKSALLADTPWDPQKFLDLQAQVGLPTEVPADSQLFHKKGRAPKVIFDVANETVYPQGSRGGPSAPAQIVFGCDRRDGKASGWGSKMCGKAASIDMVVGRYAGARGGKGVKDGQTVGNDFAADAARIYISKLTDIDKNFGIVEGRSGQMKERSGIAVKADGVRIIGREGVKIVTGAADGWKGFGMTGEPNSLGEKLLPAPTIELLAGNNSDAVEVTGGLFNSPETFNNLQGVARGENVVEAFRDLSEILDGIWAAVYSFMTSQMQINASIAPCIAATAGPGSPAAGSAMGSIIAIYTPLMLNRSLGPMTQARNNKVIWEVNHLHRQGYRFLESRNVLST